jgi:hypothetical protein
MTMNKVVELIKEKRPLMNYTGYSDKWYTVEIADQFAGHWSWGEGPYYDWCDDNCSEFYNIVKYSHRTIHGRFRNAHDALMFKLKWA